MVDPRPVVLYDADCGFCTTSANAMTGPLIRAEVVADPFQAHDLSAAGLTAQECGQSLHVLADGRVYIGAAAVSRVLRAGRAPWPFLGRVLQAPGIRWVAERGYRLVARFRHRLPGATAACELP